MNYNQEIQRYLKRYIGSRCRYFYDGELIGDFILDQYSDNMIFGSKIGATEEEEKNYQDYFEIELDDEKTLIQLMLIHPEDMTRGQHKMYDTLCHHNHFKINHIDWKTDSPESILYLIETHIDAFNLIERGLAIDISGKQRKYEQVVYEPEEEFIQQEHPRIAVAKSNIYACPVCKGTGKVKDKKTNNDRNCVLCNGIGKAALINSTKEIV